MGWADIFQQPAQPTADNPIRTTQPVGGGIQAPGIAHPDILEWQAGGSVGPRPVYDPATDRTTQPVGQPQLPQGDQNIQQIVHAFLQGKPAGPETLQALKQHLAQQGIQIEIPTRAGGTALSNDKIVLPNQQVIDLFGDEGGANSLQWGDSGFWVNGQPSSTPGVVTPFAPEGPAGFSQTGVNGLASFDAPGINKPFTQQFSFNPSDMANSEAYQFAMSEGLKGVTQNAAARGTLNTGGTLKDLTKYAGGLAAQNYGDEFDRRYRVYTGDKDTYFRNADSSWNRLSSLANYGAGAAGKYADSVASIYGNQGNVNAARAGNPPWWQAGVNTGIAAGADALFNRS